MPGSPTSTGWCWRGGPPPPASGGGGGGRGGGGGGGGRAPPWMLINAGGAAGRTLTSWPSLQTDLRNAGAHWVDQTVVTDGRLVTSRKPDDLPAFCDAIVALFRNAA